MFACVVLSVCVVVLFVWFYLFVLCSVCFVLFVSFPLPVLRKDVFSRCFHCSWCCVLFVGVDVPVVVFPRTPTKTGPEQTAVNLSLIVSVIGWLVGVFVL